MAERRLPLAVEDDEGISRRGEVIIVRAWRPELKLSPHAAFTIVLCQQPPAPDSMPPAAPNVVACAPAVPVRLPAVAAEAAAAYGAAEVAAPTLRLPRPALEAYADGSLLAARPLAMTAREVFGGGVRYPRLDALARGLLAASQQADRYWQALEEVLSWPSSPTPLVQPQRLRARLRDALRQTPPLRRDAPGADAIARLREIAAGTAPQDIAPSPAALAEDAAFIRCLADQREAAEELAVLRSYLDGAGPGPQTPTLRVDHAATREQLSFVTLLAERHRLEGMRAAFETFRSAFAAAYMRHHQTYWPAFARLRATLEETAPAAQALARLNTLRALGRPVGQEALAACERLMLGRSVCAGQDLEAGLRERPACPECRITMEESTPREAVEEALHGLHRALATQQARLASEAVHRILARGGERLARFLQIVQASDTAGLVQVLDDDLLAFLRELLAEPVAPTPEALDLFEELARTYPVVREEQVDAVVDTLRRLLTEQLASQRAADPARPPAFPLASPPPPP